MPTIDDALLTTHARAELQRAQQRINYPHVAVSVCHISVRAPYVMVRIADDTDASGIGFAKCSPHDKFDPSIGISIATFRAVRDLVV